MKKSDGFGNTCCTVNDLFELNKKFIVDGKLTVKVEGILKLNEEMDHFQSKNFKDLWNIGFEDFKITAGQEEIKVHKNVLAAQSPVFSAMFNKKFKDGIENCVEIPKFLFETVEIAIRICHNQNIDFDILLMTLFCFLNLLINMILKFLMLAFKNLNKL